MQFQNVDTGSRVTGFPEMCTLNDPEVGIAEVNPIVEHADNRDGGLTFSTTSNVPSCSVRGFRSTDRLEEIPDRIGRRPEDRRDNAERDDPP